MYEREEQTSINSEDIRKRELMRRHLRNTIYTRKLFQHSSKKAPPNSNVVYIDTADPIQFADQISAYTAEGYNITATAQMFKRLQAVCVKQGYNGEKEDDYAYSNDC